MCYNNDGILRKSLQNQSVLLKLISYIHSAFQDFSTLIENITIPARGTEGCTNIHIHIPDNLVEREESFTIDLTIVEGGERFATVGENGTAEVVIAADPG